MFDIVYLTETELFQMQENVEHTTNQDLFNITYNSFNNRFYSLAMYYSKHVRLVCHDNMNEISIATITKSSFSNTKLTISLDHIHPRKLLFLI